MPDGFPALQESRHNSQDFVRPPKKEVAASREVDQSRVWNDVRCMPGNRLPERISPRLLNMRQAAEYLGCSFWTARDYILQGLIAVVDLPPLRQRKGARARKTLRRVLVDRTDLDAFIEARKRR